MKNKKWKKFQLLTEECYNNMIGFGENNDCWKQAFELLMEIVLEERKQKRDLVKQSFCYQDVSSQCIFIAGRRNTPTS